MHDTSRDRDDPDRNPALFVDLYEVTMAQAYANAGMTQTAVFELFFRALPPRRNYVLACGLADVVERIESFRFDADDIAYLRDQGPFDPAFLDMLADLRFTGDVDAVPEGTLVFPDEPLLQVTAPLVEAQLLETLALNRLHAGCLFATKAARLVRAARGRTVVDFGARRTQGLDAALVMARAGWIAGLAGTSNLFAGRRWGLPTFGTMAHSYVQAHDDEATAFRRFAREFPGTTLLVDTYDTLAGVDTVVRLARELGDGFDVGGVRLDSGDLAELSRRVRERLDGAGLDQVRIIASGGLDEDAIDHLLAGGAPIDGFGVGTSLGVSADAPAIDLAYKLVEYAGRPRLKTSGKKATLPGRKQVVRHRRDGRLAHDVLGRRDEKLDGEPLLIPIMRAGKRVPGAVADLATARERAHAQMESLPGHLHALERAEPAYEVALTAALQDTRDRLRERAS